MGKKKEQHASQSFGQMVSKAALTQLLPSIEGMVNNLGSRLAMQQARTYELVFSRILVIEKILMEKHGITETDLANKFADVEDERAKLTKADVVQVGDTVRLEVKTKNTGDKEYQGSTRLKAQNFGTGINLGEELEKAALGMKVDEVREVAFGEKGESTASIQVNRISRPAPKAPTVLETENANTPAG